MVHWDPRLQVVAEVHGKALVSLVVSGHAEAGHPEEYVRVIVTVIAGKVIAAGIDRSVTDVLAGADPGNSRDK